MLARQLDGQLQAWRTRRLETEYSYLVADAWYEKVRRDHQVISQGVLVVIGVSKEGYREVLGIWMAESESEASWSAVFSELAGRRLTGVEYVVSGDHKGLRRAIDRHFQGALWRRCQVHFMRNILHVRARDRS